MPITQEENDRLTLVGPGTPMGSLLRRYWQPVGTVVELECEPVQKTRLLGEDLTLYRTPLGEYGLIGDICPHRCVSFEYGIPDPRGLRCAYHGWLFNGEGRCIEQPFEDTLEPAGLGKSGITTAAYPVQELGGLIFAYLGPNPAPLLPRWDLLVRDDLDRLIEMHELPCNWLQTMDNAADPVHVEHLHAVFGNYQLEKLGRPPGMTPSRHLKIEFDEFEYGIMKRRLIEGQSPDDDDWTVGHPLIFPNILAVGTADKPTLQFRVAVDDTTTIQYAYRTSVHSPGEPPRPTTAIRAELFEADGTIRVDNVPKQDMVAWIAQNKISPRTREHLARSDKGVIMYHQMLLDQIEVIERGGDPKGTVRDRTVNEPWIDIRRERAGRQGFRSTYGNHYDNLLLEEVKV